MFKYVVFICTLLVSHSAFAQVCWLKVRGETILDRADCSMAYDEKLEAYDIEFSDYIVMRVYKDIFFWNGDNESIGPGDPRQWNMKSLGQVIIKTGPDSQCWYNDKVTLCYSE